MSLGADPSQIVRATNKHYDQDPELFGLFLDESLKYSSGLYLREDDDLDRAQRQKLKLIAAELGLGAGERVLDVGCGWGSLILAFAGRGCCAVGVTPSPRQARFIRERAEDRGLSERVRVECSSFEDAAVEERCFHAVTLVGSIVHMPDKAATLAKAYRACRPGGRLYLSETCFRSESRYRQFNGNPELGFVRDDIFGWGDPVPVSRYVAYLEEAGFSLCNLIDLTEHYRRTIAEWRRRVEERRDRIDRFGPELSSRFIRYFDISNAAWGFTTKQYALVAVRRR